jgi:hypothetical protein
MEVKLIESKEATETTSTAEPHKPSSRPDRDHMDVPPRDEIIIQRYLN